MGTVPAFASAAEAMQLVRAGLDYLAAVDATAMPAEEQARSLRALEQASSVATAARTSILGAFAAGQGYTADADYSPRSWLIHKTGVTRGAAVACTAWVKRAEAHPRIAAELAAGQITESVARTLCLWTDKALRLVTTLGGAGVLHGDLNPECAAAVQAVLDALSAPADAEDTRTREQRCHDALGEASAGWIFASWLRYGQHTGRAGASPGQGGPLCAAERELWRGGVGIHPGRAGHRPHAAAPSWPPATTGSTLPARSIVGVGCANGRTDTRPDVALRL